VVLINTLLLILFIGINIGLARYDAYRIKNNFRIKHTINAVIYVGLILLFWKWLTITKVLGILLLRIPVFNTSLNVFRGLSPTYLSTTTTSIIDQIMNRYIEKIGYWIYNGIIFGGSIFLLFFH
jgi:hypothetical protein